MMATQGDGSGTQLDIYNCHAIFPADIHVSRCSPPGGLYRTIAGERARCAVDVRGCQETSCLQSCIICCLFRPILFRYARADLLRVQGLQNQETSMMYPERRSFVCRFYTGVTFYPKASAGQDFSKDPMRDKMKGDSAATLSAFLLLRISV